MNINIGDDINHLAHGNGTIKSESNDYFGIEWEEKCHLKESLVLKSSVKLVMDKERIIDLFYQMLADEDCETIFRVLVTEFTYKQFIVLRYHKLYSHSILLKHLITPNHVIDMDELNRVLKKHFCDKIFDYIVNAYYGKENTTSFERCYERDMELKKRNI